VREMAISRGRKRGQLEDGHEGDVETRG